MKRKSRRRGRRLAASTKAKISRALKGRKRKKGSSLKRKILKSAAITGGLAGVGAAGVLAGKRLEKKAYEKVQQMSKDATKSATKGATEGAVEGAFEGAAAGVKNSTKKAAKAVTETVKQIPDPIGLGQETRKEFDNAYKTPASDEVKNSAEYKVGVNAAKAVKTVRKKANKTAWQLNNRAAKDRAKRDKYLKRAKTDWAKTKKAFGFSKNLSIRDNFWLEFESRKQATTLEFARKRKPHSAATKKKISESLKGKKRARSSSQQFKDVADGVSTIAKTGINIMSAMDRRKMNTAKLADMVANRRRNNVAAISPFLSIGMREVGSRRRSSLAREGFATTMRGQDLRAQAAATRNQMAKDAAKAAARARSAKAIRNNLNRKDKTRDFINSKRAIYNEGVYINSVAKAQKEGLNARGLLNRIQ